MRTKEIYKQFARFAVVGGANTIIDLGILNIFIAAFDNADTNYPYYKAISFLCAVGNSFLMNRKFTFSKEGKGTKREVTTFLLVTLVGFAINVIMPTLVYGLMRSNGAAEALAANVGAIVGVCFSTVFNFFGYKYLVFKK